MKDQANNLQAERWTDDPAQKEQFFTDVGPTIDRESRYWTRFHGVAMDREDIASDMRLKLCEQMGKTDTDEPFDKDSPKETADFLIANYKIREPIRSNARRLGIKQRRQAEILAKVGPPDLPRDIERELLTTARSIGVLVELCDFTSRERDIFPKESLRQIGADDLDAPLLDQAAQYAGTSGPEVRAHIKDHDEAGHLSARDRKVWSRACAKVREAFDRAKLASLLVVVLALSLALLSSIHQRRSLHQNDLVNQGSLINEIALAHQSTKIHQDTLAHQIG
jgi:hypothetical protein